MSGKSTKRYYIKVLLTFHVSRHTTKMMEFHEVLDIVILPCFPSSSRTGTKSGKPTKRYYIQLLFTHVSRHTMEMMGFHEVLVFVRAPHFQSTDWWKSMIALYSNVSLICQNCSHALPRLENTEQQTNQALQCFRVLLYTLWKWWDFTKYWIP